MSENTLRDWHLRERELASGEALRLASLRDDLTVRYRLGLATFNAASIVALLTAWGSAPAALSKIGFSDLNVQVSLVFFCLGVIAAGLSIGSYQNDLIERAGYAAARVSVIDRLVALATSKEDQKDDYRGALKENKELFEKGLQLRNVALWGQHLSAAAWLGGVIIPITSLLGWK